MSYEEIKSEWDSIASQRLLDLLSGNDMSYDDILKPNVLATIKRHKRDFVLDAGCGVGVLTKEIASISGKVTAVDMSPQSIRLAQEHCGSPNIQYIASDIERFKTDISFDLAISNMVLMDTPKPDSIINNIHNMLSQNGVFIFTLTHPSFWPTYWGYNNDEGFNYMKEYEVRREFATRNRIYKNLYTRHFHRPLEYYINLITSAKFSITSISELQDTKNNQYWYPRFILFECKKL